MAVHRVLPAGKAPGRLFQPAALGPANPKAFELLSPKIKEMLPTSEEHLRIAFQPDPDWMGLT